MRKSAKKAAFFFSTALLIMFFCSGCALAVAESAAEHAYDSISDGQSPAELAMNTANGIGEDMAKRTADLAAQVGEAAYDISTRLGQALGSVFNPSATASQITEGRSELIQKGTELLNENIKGHADTFALNIDRYSDIILKKRGEEEKVSFPAKEELLGPYLCDYVYDGDTISVSSSDESVFFPSDTRFRLVGCDTPESVAREEYLEKTGKQNSEEGHSASEFTKSLVEGKQIYIEYDVEHEDRYGRQLAYVWIDTDEGLVMLQELLLTAGYAQVFTLAPNVKYADYFADLQHQAAEEGQGFWGDGFFQ